VVAVEVERVSKCFDSLTSRRGTRRRLQVLEHLSFTANGGETITLLGPSGTGKTTILRMISGLESADEGTVTVRTANPIRRPSVGYVFQQPTLLPWRTVRENVTVASRWNRIDVDPVRVTETLLSLGLAEFADWYPRALSIGMQQRVNLARAMLADPDVLLLDEPLSALDALTRDVVRRDLVRYLESRWCAVHVTHSVEDAILLSDRILILSERPARVLREFHVDLERPRDLQSLLADARTWRLRSEIEQTIRSLIPEERLFGAR
jgi:NitT/TauT family transport system ATP-binding protein